MDLHLDIILLIIQLLPIPDIRNLSRCNKKFNLLSSNKIIASYIDIDSFDWENMLNAELLKSYSKHLEIACNFSNYVEQEYLSKKEKYTFEIFCYGYVHLFPNRYVYGYNKILHSKYGRIYFNAGFNNFSNLIKFMANFSSPNYSVVAIGSISNCNLKILKFLKERKYYLSDYNWMYSVMTQQLKILKWAKNNGYTFDSRIFNNAIMNKHLDILKFAYKNNYIDANTYKQATLNN